jgi:hemoglobin
MDALYTPASSVYPSPRNLGRCVVAKSLFERLGGTGAVTAVVEDFSARCAGDSRINAKFARTDIPRLRSMLIAQVSEATGGPARYTGRDMKTAHADMGVTTGEFNALVEDLVATLNKFGVGKTEQDELLGILGPLKSDIVELDSSKTGTPLPQGYQPAPALAKSGS